MLNYTLGTIEASEALIKDLYIDLRAKVNAWSKITQQTPQARMGYVGQHLVSVVTGYPGGKSGARGYDLVIDDERHGEIKTCYRVDQLGSCNACGAVVSSLETECAVCSSTSINRKDDSKWLIAIRNNDEFAKLLDPYRYYFVLFEFESIYDSNNNDIIASIWEVDPKSKGFAYCMIDYYLNIRSQSTSKAPFNMWPHMLYLHFTMDDNLSLDEKIKARYEGMYSGVFYDRYIRGLWTVAEGLIYTMFNKDYHVVPSVPRDYEEYLISCDYGTLNPTSAGLWGLCEGKWYRVREYYYDGRKERYQRTDEEHYAAIEELAGDLSIRKIIVDPSAASFIEVIRRHDRFMVEQASNRVLDGIRDVATRLNAGDIFFCDCCTDCIREFGLYRWDEKAAEDRPLKTDDHAMDDMRYFVRAAFQPSRFSF